MVDVKYQLVHHFVFILIQSVVFICSLVIIGSTAVRGFVGVLHKSALLQGNPSQNGHQTSPPRGTGNRWLGARQPKLSLKLLKLVVALVASVEMGCDALNL